ncbi:MAG: creatininase family protein [Puniceicoccaceae bacterium]
MYFGDDLAAWHHLRWPQFAAMERPSEVLVVQPVYSFCDWNEDLPLNSEEVIGSWVLRECLREIAGKVHLLVLPPFRFTPRQSPGARFHLETEIAHQILEETILSASDSGFRNFILWNSNPWLEDWVDAVARDLRVAFDLRLYCLQLAGFGFDMRFLGEDNEPLAMLLKALVAGESERVESGLAREGICQLARALEEIDTAVEESGKILKK